MSQENVEVVRKLYEACVRDDFDQALTHCDPDLVYKPAQEAAAHGADAVRAAWERWASDVERLEARAEEFLDTGNCVLLTILFRGRGRGSGIESDARFYEVFILRDNKVLHWEEFTDRSQALEAAGLRE
jgi:ketosteroid isomerase-like protein